MLPIILVAPHSQSTMDESLRDRYALTDYEIWKCSDPYTDRLDEFTCASAKHTANINRLACDLNRAPNTQDAFREFDFFGRRVFKDGDELSTKEKENMLIKYWYPFHQGIVEDVQRLDDEGHDAILIVDYHNTSGDHALNKHHDYMTSLIFSNLGTDCAYGNSEGISIPYRYLYGLQDFISENLQITAEINRIYRGGYNLYWYTHLKEILNINAKIYAVQIEYNLDYVFNPITKKFDESALEMMQKYINDGLLHMIRKIMADISKKERVNVNL